MQAIVRSAALEDAEAVRSIYEFHVLQGTASFDTVPRTLQETEERIALIKARGWPFLVAEFQNRVVGYAYVTQFRDRAAYASTCENSIYIAGHFLGKGIGTALLAQLIIQAEQLGFRQMIAVVGGGEAASIALHEKLGFTHAGQMKSVGWKMGRWLDTVYMQLPLGPGDKIAPEQQPV